jgi:hypothetical protein
LQHSNWGVSPAERKIVVQQSGNRTGRKIDLVMAIRGSSQLEEKLQRGNQGIMLAQMK